MIERAQFDSFDLENYNCSGQGLLIERAREKEQICHKLPMQLPPTSLSVPTAQRSVVGRWLILDRSEQRLTLLDSPDNLGPSRNPSRELQWNCFLHEKRPCGHCRLALIIMSQDACEAARLGLDAERSSRLRTFFDHYDIDQNHVLDTNELECMLLELGHEADHTITRALQDEFGDVSHGGISFSAFLRLVAKHEGNNAALTGGEPTSLNNPITFFRRFSLSVAHAAGLTKGEDECALWFCGLRSWSPIAPGERSSPPSSSLPPSTSEDLSLSLPPVCTCT